MIKILVSLAVIYILHKQFNRNQEEHVNALLVM